MSYFLYHAVDSLNEDLPDPRAYLAICMSM